MERPFAKESHVLWSGARCFLSLLLACLRASDDVIKPKHVEAASCCKEHCEVEARRKPRCQERKGWELRSLDCL
jgi:hypothetical protein